MARSPTHRFGQIIGNTVEDALEPRLREFADEHDLYLDRESSDRRRSGKTVRWEDAFGNDHKLDYVLEKDGTVDERGDPMAFIEVAWRRYTKHSKNKAQEIQGAIRPLLKKYDNKAPFSGAVIAGEFTDNALKQMESLGFTILYFDYDSITEAFAREGIDAYWEEDTPNEEVQEEVDKWEALSEDAQVRIAEHLVDLNKDSIDKFFRELTAAVTRTIDVVRILPLSGEAEDFNTLEQAMNFLDSVDEDHNSGPIVRYEVQVRYDNGDEITGEFGSKQNAKSFLEIAVESQSSLDQFS
jgi:hypothetical protein